MKKNILTKIFILLFLNIFILKGQEKTNIEIQWGECKGIQIRNTDFLSGDKNLYKHYYDDEKMYIDSYDENLKLILTSKIEIDQEKEYTQKTFYLKNNIYTLIIKNNIKEETRYFFLHKIDAKTLKLVDKKELLSTELSNRETGKVEISISPDKSKLLFFIVDGDKPRKNKFAIIVISEEGDVVWQKRVQLPYKEKLYKNKDILIDNDGNVCLVGNLLFENKKKRKVKNKPNSIQVFNIFKDKGNTRKELSCSLGDKFVNQIKISSNNKDIFCTGLYSDKNDHKMKGVFSFQLNKEIKEQTKINFQEIKYDSLQENNSNQIDDKEHINIDKVIFNDKNIFIIAEQNWIIFRGDANNYKPDIYVHSNISIIKLSLNGDIEWIRKIPKTQWGYTRYHLSYFSTIIEDKVYLIYNDNPKNIKINDAKEIVKYMESDKNNIAVLVTINEDGTYQKQKITLKNKYINLSPKSFKSISNDIYIIGNENKYDKLCIGKITIK